jgi:hypothetical protein
MKDKFEAKKATQSEKKVFCKYLEYEIPLSRCTPVRDDKRCKACEGLTLKRTQGKKNRNRGHTSTTPSTEVEVGSKKPATKEDALQEKTHDSSADRIQEKFKNRRIIDGWEIKDLTGMKDDDLLYYVFNTNLEPSNYSKVELRGLIDSEEINYDPNWMGPGSLRFQLSNFLDFVKAHQINLEGTCGHLSEPGEPDKAFDGEQRRELGQLRLEKTKWEDSLAAMHIATLFYQKQNQPITREQLRTELEKSGFGSIPYTIFERIWKTIPGRFRNLGGRPKKT